MCKRKQSNVLTNREVQYLHGRMCKRKQSNVLTNREVQYLHGRMCKRKQSNVLTWSKLSLCACRLLKPSWIRPHTPQMPSKTRSPRNLCKSSPPRYSHAALSVLSRVINANASNEFASYNRWTNLPLSKGCICPSKPSNEFASCICPSKPSNEFASCICFSKL
jgi:hypothetical protein